MAEVDLVGATIGRNELGLGEWVVIAKAPPVKRARFWTVEHSACGTRVDLPQTMLSKAIAGKGTLPPCATCTPAAERPAISHGQHMACGTSHPIGTPCAAEGVGPGQCKHAVALAACAECAPLAGLPAPEEPSAQCPHGGVRGVAGFTCTRCGPVGEVAPAVAEATSWSLDSLPEEPDEDDVACLCGVRHGGIDECPEAEQDDGPEILTLAGPEVVVELAQAWDAIPAPETPGLTIGQAPEPIEYDAPTSLVPHPTSPVARVHGRAESFEGPQDMLEILWAGCSREAAAPTGRAGMASLGGCERKLGYRLAFGKSAQEGGWRAFVGTAVDAAVKELFLADNARRVAAGLPERWIVGLFVDDPAEGELDIFDIETGRLVDLKTSGVTTIRRTVAGSVDDRYEVQLDLYGDALTRLGYVVRSVALLVVPAAGDLRASVTSRDAVPAWYERAWDPERARNAIARRDRINLLIGFAKGNGLPLERVLASLSAQPDYCSGCPVLVAGWCPEGAAGTATKPALTFGGAA